MTDSNTFLERFFDASLIPADTTDERLGHYQSAAKEPFRNNLQQSEKPGQMKGLRVMKAGRLAGKASPADGESRMARQQKG